MSSLRCRLVDCHGRERTGEVLGVHTHSGESRLTVEFGRGEDVVLPLGDQVGVALFGPDLYLPHEFRGCPVLRSVVSGSQRYQFRVDPSRRFELDMVVGGRGAVRVSPKGSQPVQVELLLPDGSDSILCPLHDASVTGVSVEIGWAQEKRLAPVRELDVLVHLPDLGQGPSLHVHVRRRTVDGVRIVYGLVLDSAETPAANASVKALAAWVETRYQELSGGARVLRRTG
ncbi:MAG: hypothetical protein O2816_07255 [Planctomycetota bacterium]|nr:hypothetical protein [Planctomycetota bacterium]